MVSMVENDFYRNPRTLCDWVQNFRSKQRMMKRKLRGGDLRVRAILSTALHSAEQELQQKQQERLKSWLQMQAKYECSTEIGPSKQQAIKIDSANEEQWSMCIKDRDEVESLWKNELSDLDQFMKSLSKTSGNQQQQHHHQHFYQCNTSASVTS